MTNLKIPSEEDFLDLFELDSTVSFKDFCSRLSVLPNLDANGELSQGGSVGISFDDYIKKVAKKKDPRLNPKRMLLYKRNLYNIIVTNARESLSQWFRKRVKMTKPLEFFFEIPTADILEGHVFNGTASNQTGKLCKNINFTEFYNTKKLHANDNMYILSIFSAMFERFQVRRSIVGPAMFDFICNNVEDYSGLWDFVMMTASRPSVFNPATYKGIMEELFEGETIFAPVMGWNAYQIGFYSTNWKHFIATDVIPSVVENGKLLHKEWENYNQLKSTLYYDEKTVDLYCCPSEQLQARHGFVDKYRGKVDAVLFSPPYFDLEIYDSPDQSFTNFPNYDDWLKGYWEETVKIAAEVLRKEGRFAFVISNYRNYRNEYNTISTDMRDVAISVFGKVKSHYQVRWNSMGHSRVAGKHKDGNYEDLWLFEKR